MKNIQIILHCLPREIDDTDRILDQLHKSSFYLSDNDKITLDVTLNLSDKLTNWNESLLPKEYFVDRFRLMEKKSDWTYHNIFDVNESDKCLGINDKRRNSLREHNPSHFMYLDTDVYFSQFNLSYIFRALEQIKNEYHIVSSQLLRLWDDSWNVISNERFIPMGTESKIWKTFDPFGIDKECFDNLDYVGVKKISEIKFGGGWFNIFSSNLLKFIDIPDSFGSYGLDDTYIMECSNLMKQRGYDISQYVINNMLVMENRKYRFHPYEKFLKDATIDESHREEKRNSANAKYVLEINKFIRKLEE
tara:strand:+ start:428 stop:1342 length:915 start_codon:yes stop_codon:yes gene_type:complete